MNINFLMNTELFKGCSPSEISLLAEHLKFRVDDYQKEATILKEGSIIQDIGLVLDGSVRIEHIDIYGNKSIFGIVHAGEVFAEAYACTQQALMVEVTANTNCEILYISVPKLLRPCNVCQSQRQLINNLLKISAQKNLQLSLRSSHTSFKTIRGKLISYFSQLVASQKTNHVSIPFNRQQLADYLNVERSALSKELGKMKKDGLIDYEKKQFIIYLDQQKKRL